MPSILTVDDLSIASFVPMCDMVNLGAILSNGVMKLYRSSISAPGKHLSLNKRGGGGGGGSYSGKEWDQL